MTRIIRKALSAVSLLVFAASAILPAEASSSAASLAHVDHALRAFPATPGGSGLVDAAMADARVALVHAGLAASDPDDLASMKRHVGHVLHAVDPALIDNGPGSGYGSRKAAQETARHIELAAQADGASDNVKLHSKHIASSARNAVARMDRIVQLAADVEEAKTAQDAAPLVQEINTLAEQTISGLDADGDGRMTWQEGEGGLETAVLHGGFLMKGEGIE